MKLSKIIGLLLVISLTLVSMTSCDFMSNLFHKHSWEIFLAKEPTCTEIGLLRNVCLKCGAVEYVEINMSNHEFENDVCVYCGGHKDELSQIQKVPLLYGSSTDGMWSMNKIYEVACDVALKGSYDYFINSLSKGSLKNARIDTDGILSLTAMYLSSSGSIKEVPLAVPYKAVSSINSGASQGTLWSIYVQNKTLILTYVNGKELVAGTFDSSNSAYIIGFGINSVKELVIYYSDNTIGFGGKISS